MTVSAVRVEPTPARDAVADGVERLLDSYARIQNTDQAVIAYAANSRKYAASIMLALRARGIPVATVAMRPFIDPEFRSELHAVLPAPAELTGKLVVFTLEKDSMSHFPVFAELSDIYGKHACKIVRVISASDELFEFALNPSPKELALRNATLLAKLRAETVVRVTTPAGTDVQIELDHKRYDWISNRGEWRPGAFMILPAGEIATYPALVNGTLVADGALNCNIVTRMDMRLAANPLTIKIEDSVGVSFHCDNPEIDYLVDGCFSRDNGRKIGELGFGTNTGTTAFVADNSHMNERFPGLHLGFGQHNQPETVVPYRAEIHLDVVTHGGTLHLPNDNSTLDLADFVPIAGINHPALIRDEDITGDCCSAGCSVRMTLV
jgi:hypothetical protein